MTNIRIHELPEATSWNGFFPQDKPGGPTECVSVATVEARLVVDGFVKTAVLVAGYQPLENQRLRTTDNVNFNKLQIAGIDRITPAGGFVGTSLQISGATANKLARFDASKNLVSYDLVAADIPVTIASNTTGSAAKWTTPRTLTIGATGKALDGSANVSWSLAEIGAAPAFTSSSAGQVWATPAASSGVPGLRLLVASDIPALNYLAPSAMAGTAGQIAAFTGTNTVSSDVGLTRVQSSGKTYQVIIGDGTASSPSSLILKNPTANSSMFEIWEGANRRFQMGRSGTSFAMSSYTTGGVGIDDPLTIALASGGEIKLGGSTSRPINLAGGSRLQINGTDAITSARVGDLASLKIEGVERISASGGFIGTSLQISGPLSASQATYTTRIGTTSAYNSGPALEGFLTATPTTKVFSIGYDAAMESTQIKHKGLGVINIFDSQTDIWGPVIALRAGSAVDIQGGDLKMNGTVRISYLGVGDLTGLKINTVSVVGTRKTGWDAATGTATRTTFETASVTTAQLAERVKGLIDDLISHGLIGT